MAKEVIMPRFGMTQEEATIVRWIIKDGQPVEIGDPICEVTTDKVNMEVEAPADGILAGIRFGEGETVPVTEIIAYIVAEGESPPSVEPRKMQPPPIQQQEPTELKPAVYIPGDGKDINATPVARRMAAIEEIELSAVPGSGPAGKVTRQDVEHYLEGGRGPSSIQTEGGKVRASPGARRLARQRGVALSQIRGSGPKRRIQGWDVPTAVSPQIGTSADLQPTVIELQGIRATIAQRMQASWQTIPHIMFSVDVDMNRAIAMRESLNERYGDQKSTISITAVLVKACAAALQQHPQLNSYFIDDQILLMPDINLGVAVALDEGLIVPVVRQANLKSLYQIGGEVSDLSNRARGGNLRPEDVVDGTFTISNLGMFSVDHFTAIINPPQVAILAVGRTLQRYVPDEAGQPVLRPMMTVTLSVDHRAVDGALAAHFLTTLKGILDTAGAQWG